MLLCLTLLHITVSGELHAPLRISGGSPTRHPQLRLRGGFELHRQEATYRAQASHPLASLCCAGYAAHAGTRLRAGAGYRRWLFVWRQEGGPRGCRTWLRLQALQAVSSAACDCTLRTGQEPLRQQEPVIVNAAASSMGAQVRRPEGPQTGVCRGPGVSAVCWRALPDDLLGILPSADLHAAAAQGHRNSLIPTCLASSLSSRF